MIKYFRFLKVETRSKQGEKCLVGLDNVHCWLEIARWLHCIILFARFLTDIDIIIITEVRKSDVWSLIELKHFYRMWIWSIVCYPVTCLWLLSCDFVVVNAYKVFPRQRLQSTYILMLNLLSLSLSHLLTLVGNRDDWLMLCLKEWMFLSHVLPVVVIICDFCWNDLLTWWVWQ